jgi:hypothetical protein
MTAFGNWERSCGIGWDMTMTGMCRGKGQSRNWLS